MNRHAHCSCSVWNRTGETMTTIRWNERTEDRSAVASGGSEKARNAEIGRMRQEILRLRERVNRLGIYRFMAYRDDLTGLSNRRYMNECLRDECDRAARTVEYRFSLILADVDDFKSVNDTYGHSAGDELLIMVARILEKSVRRSDRCFRMGGDEFAILLPGTKEAGADRLSARLRERLAQASRRLPYRLSLSLGAVGSEGRSAEPAQLVAAADEAMYAAKRRAKR